MIKRPTRGLCASTLALLMACSSPASLAQMAGPKGQSGAGADQKTVKSLSPEQKALHLLDRTAFGPRSGDLERVMKMGWQKYLEEQLHPERLSDELVEQKLKSLESIHLSSQELAQRYQSPQMIRQALKARGLERPESTEAPSASKQPDEAPTPSKTDEFEKRREVRLALLEMGYKPQQRLVQELQQAKILRAVYSRRQLQEVMTDFWFNHFNVYIQKGADRILTTAYEREAIRPRALGKFEDLLLATAQSPAMLFYLDNWMSSAAVLKNGETPQGRRRGLNENYAREIMELHTLGVDGGYTQKDVQEVARCFTGWTIRAPRLGGDFFFNPRLHDDGEKIVLGHKIAAGGGRKDGETVIKILARHPSTARFIARKLAWKFVSDNPPPALVERLAQTFSMSDGKIGEVLQVLFNSPEFWAPQNYRAKIKTPFEMTVSAVRAVGAETDGGPAFHRWMARMGEGLFMAQPPTGYPETADHWVNSGTLLERMNFALALSANRIPGSQVNLEPLAAETVDGYVKLLLHDEISPKSKAQIDRALAENVAGRAEEKRNSANIARVIGLILGSPEFQRQ
ncbi:MAG TPA: DUF1800 domain-containing protein [Blastocatellia bacterium]|nr:DUF1800 domain-containing protein [Blastocatellia bacterium]